MVSPSNTGECAPTALNWEESSSAEQIKLYQAKVISLDTMYRDLP